MTALRTKVGDNPSPAPGAAGQLCSDLSLGGSVVPWQPGSVCCCCSLGSSERSQPAWCSALQRREGSAGCSQLLLFSRGVIVLHDCSGTVTFLLVSTRQNAGWVLVSLDRRRVCLGLTSSWTKLSLLKAVSVVCFQTCYFSEGY